MYKHGLVLCSFVFCCCFFHFVLEEGFKLQFCFLRHLLWFFTKQPTLIGCSSTPTRLHSPMHQVLPPAGILQQFPSHVMLVLSPHWKALIDIPNAVSACWAPVIFYLSPAPWLCIITCLPLCTCSLEQRMCGPCKPVGRPTPRRPLFQALSSTKAPRLSIKILLGSSKYTLTMTTCYKYDTYCLI